MKFALLKVIKFMITFKVFDIKYLTIIEGQKNLGANFEAKH
jgi:hypothetical protein